MAVALHELRSASAAAAADDDKREQIARYDLLYRELYLKIRNFARKYARCSRDAADDYTQTAFERLWRDWTREPSARAAARGERRLCEQPPSAVSSWLTKVIAHLVIDERRRARIQQIRPLAEESAQLRACFDDDHPAARWNYPLSGGWPDGDPERVALSREALAEYLRAAAGPATYGKNGRDRSDDQVRTLRTLLWLGEGQTHRDIAARLGKTPSATKMLAHRAFLRVEAAGLAGTEAGEVAP